MESLKLLFVGDIMPGGVLHYQERFYTDKVKKFIQSFDLRIGTLEVAIGNNIPFDEVKMKGRMNIIYCKNCDIQKLLDLDINIVSLANNHIFDLGIKGLENTKKILSENNIKYCGAGKNIKEASEPVIINYSGKQIVFLAYSDCDVSTMAYVPAATESSYGVNPLVIENVVADIKYYKNKCDYVFVMPHWGKEYSVYPTKKMKDYSKIMINAGADMIIGSHTHIVQPCIEYKSKKIFYSLGNFLFPDFFMNKPRPIWYPEKDYDLTSIETTYDYPFPVTKPLKRVWRDFSRIGLMVGVNVNDKLETTKQSSILRKDNIIDLYKNKKSDLKMYILSKLIKSPFYCGGIYLNRIQSKLYRISKYIRK